MRRRFKLRDKTVVLTGAAGGLGEALARELVARGARVALLDLDEPALGVLAAELGPSVHPWRADVTDSESLKAAFSGAVERFGGVDVAVANAGINLFASVEAGDPRSFERLIDVNLNGAYRTLQAALPHVRERSGHLLVTSSMACFVHSPLQSAYSASKAGVYALVNSLRQELRGTGVTCGTLHPTFFATPMLDESLADPAGALVWKGNTGGIWKQTTVEAVVAAAVAGIERRAKTTVVPRRLKTVALFPGIMRPVIERIGFNDQDIREAVEAADPSGWSDPEARDRAGVDGAGPGGA